MKKLRIAKAILAIVSAAAMILIGFTGLTPKAYATMPANTATAQGAASSTNRNVTVTAFQQNWNSIAKECTETYGPEGVGYVQVSPPQETVRGKQWWTSYQVASYNLNSKLGTEAEFKQMVSTCRAAGVGVIADAVINHTTGVDRKEGVGTAGSTFDIEGNFPAIGYTKDDFHTCDHNIGNYHDAQEVWNCRLSGLQDLDTSREHVQDIIAGYMAKLLKMGVAGFRIDAVKHIDPKDVSAIKAKLAQKSGIAEDKIYWNQETLGNASEAAEIQPKNYTGTGEVHEMDFAYSLKNAFNGNFGGVAGLKNIENKLLPSQQAGVFVSNWDTERNGSTLSYKDGSRYLLANAFMLAYGYGTPSINSGYKFEDSQDGHDSGAPGATDTTVPDTVCSTDSGWLCVQRWTAIRGMVGFHNNITGKVTNWWSNGSDAIGFERDKTGYLAINNSDKEIRRTFTSSLPAGEYCNVYAAGDCSSTVTVGADGSFETTVPAHSAVAIYTKALKSTWQGGQKSNPLDPAEDQPKPEQEDTDNSITVYYRTGWSNPHIHHQAAGTADGWTKVPGDKMTKACDGYYSASVPLINGKLEFVFNDGNNNWDHPAGNPNGNFTVTEKKDITVADGTITAANPCPVKYQPKTKLTVHYKPKAGDAAADKRGVYVWGTQKDGTQLDGKYYKFNQADDAFGKVFTMEFDGAFDHLGAIVTTEDWNKDGQKDRIIDTSGGSAEVWVQGGDETTYTDPPADAGKTIRKLDVTIHYRRADNNYAGWDVWKWADGIADNLPATFRSHDSFGKIAQYSLQGDSVKHPKFIIRYGGSAWKGREGNGKDANGDREIPWSAITMTGTDTAKAEIWIVSGDTTVYTSPNNVDTSNKITNAEISRLNEITLKLNRPVSESDLAGKISLDTAKIKSFKVVDGSKVVITTESEIAPDSAVKVKIAGYNEATAVAGSVVRTEAFDKKYAYSGDDLGASYTPEGTTFKIWAPTATSVKLNTYKGTKPDAEIDKVYDMQRGEKGVWTVTVPGDCRNLAYDFTVGFADGRKNESADPYGRASTANGGRSVVLSPEQMKPAHWGSRMPAFSSPTDAVITEMSVRDFSKSDTSGVSKDKQGKYLGVIEKGTKNSKGESTGLDYLKKSGTTHVQIMPMYDFNNINGEIGNNVAYNWGYDPMNYNVPEGSYSSDPANPATRITEMKQMIQGLHDSGIRTIMDVVYNHVYDANKHVFNQVVPGYYFRYDSNGNLVSNSGCGNDTASERAMMRKYIVDSVTYWAKNYNIDGFRFDLMGLIDKETMKEVRAALDKIDPSIMIVGEGWDMNSTMPKSEMSIQPNARELTTDKSTIGFFNDSYRDAVKGSVFDSKAKGFVQGNKGQENLLANNFLGCQNRSGFAPCTNGNANTNYSGPSQVVQYVEVHDNLTLYDKLKASMPGESEQNITKRDELANSMVLLSQGIPEIQIGQAFMRTKGGDDNSYNKPDSVNAVDWDRLSEYKASADYVRGLIALRKAVPALRQKSFADLNAHSRVLAQADGTLAFELSDPTGTYVVAFNANTEGRKISGLKNAKYTVVASEGKVDEAAVNEIASIVRNGAKNVRTGSSPKFTEVQSDGTYTVPALSAVVLREGQLLEEPEPEPKPTPALKLDKHTVEAGGTVHATVEGLKPNTQYKLWLKSVPAELAVVTTDAQGRAEADVTIPAGTAAGEHTVAVTDKDADSSHVLASEKLDVTQKQNPPVTPDNPADPSKPADPADPSSPEAPDKPADPSKPGKQPGNNGKPGTPARPGSQATPLHKGGTAGRHKRGQSDRSHRPSKLSQTGVGIGTTVTVLIVLVALAVIVLIVRRQQEADGSSSTGLHGKGDDSLR